MKDPQAILLDLARNLAAKPLAHRGAVFESIRAFIHHRTNGASQSMTELANDHREAIVPAVQRAQILSDILAAVVTDDYAALDLSGNPAGEQQPTAV